MTEPEATAKLQAALPSHVRIMATGPKFDLEVTCTDCLRKFYVHPRKESLISWALTGSLAQRAFAELSDNARELLISGICGICWNRLFGDR